MRQALPGRLLTVAFAALLFSGGVLRAEAESIKLQAQLLWGANTDKSPNPSHKPVSEELKKRLKSFPLKWTHYFEVNRKTFEVAQGASKRISLSDLCEIEVKNLDGSTLEITHFGKGREVARQKQALPKKEMLVLGGNAPGATAWLIVLQRTD